MRRTLKDYQILLGQTIDPTWRSVWLIGVQCCLAAENKILFRCAEDATKFGGNWPDATKFAPPETGPINY